MPAEIIIIALLHHAVPSDFIHHGPVIFAPFYISFERSTVYNNSCKNTFDVQKTWPSKVKSYLKINARRDQQQQDMISECGQGLAY